MAVTRGATTSENPDSVTGTDASVTHTVDVGTTLLLVYIGLRDDETVDATPSWTLGGGEDLTLMKSGL